MIQLRRIRQERGLSLRELGVRAGVHAVSLVRLEAGKFDPRLSTIRKLAEALEVRVCELIDRQPPSPGSPHLRTDKKKGRSKGKVFHPRERDDHP